MIIYDDLIDEVMLHFSQKEFEQEAAEAKSNFHKSVGIFDEESLDLEAKINLFMDWYIFYRQLKSNNKTPVETLCDGDTDFVAKEEYNHLIKNICSSRHSLFEFIKVKADDIYVRDLYSGYKMVLKKSPFTIGFSKNEIFSARLFPYDDTFVFSKAFCIHPPEAQKYIQKEVKKIKKLKEDEMLKAREEFIFRLIKMRFKIDQYKHIKLEDIYTNKPKLRM